MISTADLDKIARTRLEDAKILHRADRYDGAVYLCGYAVEIALKSKICTTLSWKGFPESGSEFQGLRSFKTHDLDTLLKLSGVEGHIKENHLADWSAVASWDPQVRYNPVGDADNQDAEMMIEATENLLQVL